VVAELAEGVASVLQESVHQNLRKEIDPQVWTSNYPANPVGRPEKLQAMKLTLQPVGT
jgi:hypothetical protein